MSRTVVNGIGIDYELRGRGPALVMICGYRRSRVIWGAGLISALASSYRLVLFDNRGTGGSDKPADGYSIEAFADDTLGLMDHLGLGRAHVLGVSMGGMIAQRVAIQHPDRVEGLVLGCTHAGGDSVVQPDQEIWKLLALAPGPGMDAAEVARRQERAYYTEAFRERGRVIIDDLQRRIQRSPPPRHAVEGHLAAIAAHDAWSALDRIGAHTLVLTGSEDRLIDPANSHLIAGRIPSARVEVLADAAHFFWIERPAETARAVMEFLAAPR